MILSFGTPDDKINSSSNSFVVALGPESVSHESVEKNIYKDIMELTSSKNPPSFYQPTKGRIHPLRFNHFVTMQDMPARSDCLRTVRYNSNCGTRNGWSCNLKDTHVNLVSCKQCNIHRRSNSHTVKTECEVCCNWSYEKNSQLLSFTPPVHYPINKLSQTSGKVDPFKISFSELVGNVKEALSNITDGTWETQTAHSFLSIIPEPSLIQEIISQEQEVEDVLPPSWFSGIEL